MKNWLLLLPAAMLVLAGCASKDGVSSDDGGAYGDAQDGASTYGAGDGSDGMATPIGDDRNTIIMNDRVVYFAFDSAELDDASIELLKQHAQYLADNPGEKVRLEGHTDEQGSREYNIGLGERRAVSAQAVLLVNGATSEQLNTVSFGEERPAVYGSDDDSYAMNRRVELVYER